MHKLEALPAEVAACSRPGAWTSGDIVLCGAGGLGRRAKAEHRKRANTPLAFYPQRPSPAEKLTSGDHA